MGKDKISRKAFNGFSGFLYASIFVSMGNDLRAFAPCLFKQEFFVITVQRNAQFEIVFLGR